MAKGWNWTPRQVATEITIPQLVSIWLRNEAEGSFTVSPDEGRELLRQRKAARNASAG